MGLPVTEVGDGEGEVGRGVWKSKYIAIERQRRRERDEWVTRDATVMRRWRRVECPGNGVISEEGSTGRDLRERGHRGQRGPWLRGTCDGRRAA